VDDLKELGSRLAVTLAIAILNREFIAAVKLSEKTRTQAYEQGAVALDYLAAQPIPDAITQNVTPSSFIETVRQSSMLPSHGCSMPIASPLMPNVRPQI
jgi:hypothetical protein